MATERKQQPTKRSLSLTQVGLALGIGIIVIGMSGLDFYEQIRMKTYDQRLVARNLLFGPPPQLPSIATIDVDDRSVEIEGRFEDWDRTYHARVIDIVDALGANQVGIDFLLPEASAAKIDEATVQRSAVRTREDVLALFQNPDHALADVARRWNNVYFAQYLTEAPSYAEAQKEMAQRTPEQERRFRMEEKFSLPITAEFQKNFYAGTELWPPIDTLLATAKGVGQVQPIPDKDGIVRSNRALYVYDGRIFPMLSLTMACDYLDVPFRNIQVRPREIVLPNARVPGQSQRRDIHIPINDRGSILINWVGDFRSSFRHYPYASVLAFWENYQRDRLAAAAKEEFTRDPALSETLLMSFLSDMQEMNAFTIRLMLHQAGLPAVDMYAAIRDIAVATRFDAAIRRDQPFAEAMAQGVGRSLPDPGHWERLYDDMRLNWRLARLFEKHPGATLAEAATALGMSAPTIAPAYARLAALTAPGTGIIPPRQYPLLFLDAPAGDSAATATLNGKLGVTIKQFLRANAGEVDTVLAGISSADPANQLALSETAVRLIARSAGFPEQDYGGVIADVVRAAAFEPLIAEDKPLEEIIPEVFGGITLDQFPEDFQQAFRDDYAHLKQNLTIEKLLNAHPDLEIDAAAESLGVRASEIESGYHILRYLRATHGNIPSSAHPLVFYTLIVDGKPVFPSDFKDAVLFYGITATGGHDRNPTPFEPRYPMVGMHLNLFNQIITGNCLYQVPKWVNWLIIVALAMFMGLALPLLSPAAGGAVAVGTIVVYTAVNVVLFSKASLWMELLGPVVVIVLSYVVITVRNYIAGEKEKKFIKSAFSAYLAPEVVEQVANDPSSLRLGGEPVSITAFFSDVKSFSTIAEALPPTELVEFLNEYLTEMCDIAFRHQGTVDKFIGDAIVAFFGAPVRFDDHATRACLCAIEMQRRLAELRVGWRSQNRHEIFQRIGLNSGEMVVGNMGSRTRFNYTMMGDNVNLAARLESGAKQFGVYTMISQFTYEAAKDAIEVRELDKIVVVGRKEPVTIYELLSEKDNLAPEKQQVASLYQDGLAYYRDQRWAEAIGRFRQAGQIEDGHPDATSLIMLQRCEAILRGEVKIPADWNGVWEMTSK